MNKQILTDAPDVSPVFLLTTIFLPRNLHFNDHQQAIRRNTKICLCGILSRYSPYHTYLGPQPRKLQNLSFQKLVSCSCFEKRSFSSAPNRQKNARCQDDGERWRLQVVAIVLLGILPPKKENFHFSFVRTKKEKHGLCPNWIGNKHMWVTDCLSGMNKLILPWKGGQGHPSSQGKARTWKLVTLLTPLPPGPWTRCHQRPGPWCLQLQEGHSPAAARAGGTVRTDGRRAGLHCQWRRLILLPAPGLEALRTEGGRLFQIRALLVRRSWNLTSFLRNYTLLYFQNLSLRGSLISRIWI